jgi:hypothetical protein
MFTEYNTEGYTEKELSALNNELNERLDGIDNLDERDNVEKTFADEVAKR